jgi:predicted anti-sigma-YlaC factor YlaD
MDHDRIQKLIAGYHGGELSPEERRLVEEHAARCPQCRRELEEMGRFEEVMGKMALKQPPPETWKIYGSSVYNRLERRIGWIFLSIGAIILLFFGGYKLVEDLITAASIPLILKIGILALLAGLAVLLVSLGREQIFVRKRERYREVEK